MYVGYSIGIDQTTFFKSRITFCHSEWILSIHKLQHVIIFSNAMKNICFKFYRRPQLHRDWYGLFQNIQSLVSVPIFESCSRSHNDPVYHRGRSSPRGYWLLCDWCHGNIGIPPPCLSNLIHRQKNPGIVWRIRCLLLILE